MMTWTTVRAHLSARFSLLRSGDDWAIATVRGRPLLARAIGGRLLLALDLGRAVALEDRAVHAVNMHLRCGSLVPAAGSIALRYLVRLDRADDLFLAEEIDALVDEADRVARACAARARPEAAGDLFTAYAA